MNCEVKRAYDKWISENYDGLLVYARRYSKHPNDLLHHIYLKIRELPNLNAILTGKPWGYHILSLFRQAKMGEFSKMYRILDSVEHDVAQVSEIHCIILREEVDNVVRQLDFFDRTIFELRLDGYSMTQIAEESKISVHTIYYSLRKTTNILRKLIC